MKFLEKVRNVGKRAQLAITTAIATISMAAITCVASAAETGETAAPDMKTMLSDAGDTLMNSFNTLIQTMIPVVMGIIGSGLVIFGIIALVKLIKKVFGKVAG